MMLANCVQCGEFTTEHRHTTEAFEVFGAIYCESCALEALAEESAALVRTAPVTAQAASIEEANARLIAAAPDLYAALQPFADMDFLVIGGGSDALIAMCDRARAALDKAEGR